MSTDGPNGSALPAQPGTQHDGDPLFEALVFGFLLSGQGFNGEYPFDDKGTDPRPELAGYFEQYLEQQPDPAVGDRMMLHLAGGLWLHGEVVEVDHESARIRWDERGPCGGNVGRVASDHFGQLFREPKARSL